MINIIKITTRELITYASIYKTKNIIGNIYLIKRGKRRYSLAKLV